MQTIITRIRPDVEIPQYHTEGSVGFDLAAAVDVELQPGETGVIPTGLVILTPPGYMLMLVARSSTFKKKGLIMPHCVGIIDQDYCGPEDELALQFTNVLSDEAVEIKKGERLAQGIFVCVDKFELVECEITSESRGGFGSTGS